MVDKVLCMCVRVRMALTFRGSKFSRIALREHFVGKFCKFTVKMPCRCVLVYVV